MLLTIDAGNTNICFGLMFEGRVMGSFRLTTHTPRTSDEYGICFMNFFEANHITAEDIDDVMISSVVPKIMYSLTSAVIKYIHMEPIVVGPGIKTGVKIQTDNPREVGADRIVDVTAAYYTYHRSCIVVDFGTATTFDYISSDAVFQYTVITPGLGITASALTERAAKLPEIEIKRLDSILAKNTITGMQAGLVYGYIGQVEYIIKQMKKELNDPDALVIATGGLGKVIASGTDAIDIYDQDLAYKGMNIIYEKNTQLHHSAEK